MEQIVDNLVGKKIGQLHVLEKLKRNNLGEMCYKCKYDSGKKTIKTEYYLNARLAGYKNIANLEGQKFGKLYAVRKIGVNKRHESLYECRCDCNSEKTIIRSNLILKKKTVAEKNCGCSNASLCKDLKGQIFGRLTVIERAIGNCKSGGSRWKCKCECKKEVIVSRSSLVSGTTKSCGCIFNEYLKHLRQSLCLEVGLAAKRLVFLRYNQDARRRGLKFEILFNEFLEICELPCIYCGRNPSKVYEAHNGGVDI